MEKRNQIYHDPQFVDLKNIEQWLISFHLYDFFKVEMLNELLEEQQEKETRLKQQRISKHPTKSTKEASSQCEHLETVNCKNTSDVAIQTDFPVEAHVMEDLKEQVKTLLS